MTRSVFTESQLCRETVRQRKEKTAKEAKQRKEFVKTKRAIYKLITSNPKVATAQMQMSDKLNVSTCQVQKASTDYKK